jgi:hypothetical protein
LKDCFTEIQKFTQWWIWMFLIGMAFIPAYGIVKQLIMGVPFGNKPMSDPGLLLFAAGYLLFMAFFWYMELRTEIDEHGIRFRLRPISTRQFRWEEIERVEPVTYGFVGYGLRLSLKYGTVYNIKGNKGLAIYLKTGGRYLVGTQRERELKHCLEQLGKLGVLTGKP